jgi:hypothetical protein
VLINNWSGWKINIDVLLINLVFYEREFIMNKTHIAKITFVMVVSGAMFGCLGCSEEMASGGGKKSGVVGAWELTSESSRGTRTRMLIINEDLTGTYKGRNRERPVSDLKVEGNQLTFKVKMQWREREFVMDFKGTVKGNSLKGHWTTSRGVREVRGKKR